MKKIILFLMVTLFSFNAFAIDKYKIENNEGYEDKNVVYEFFYYGCSHCMRMNQRLENLKKKYKDNYEFVKVPIAFNSVSEMAASHYYISDALNIEKEFSNDYYRNIVIQKNPVSDNLAIDLMSYYVDKETVLNNLNSHYLKKNIETAKEKMLEYKITSTPTYVINGKYKINAEMTGGYDKLESELERILHRELTGE